MASSEAGLNTLVCSCEYCFQAGSRTLSQRA